MQRANQEWHEWLCWWDHRLAAPRHCGAPVSSLLTKNASHTLVSCALQGRVHTLALCESSRDDVVAAINQFLSPRRPAHVLIVSYETFRLHADRLKGEGACDLLICDEVRAPLLRGQRGYGQLVSVHSSSAPPHGATNMHGLQCTAAIMLGHGMHSHTHQPAKAHPMADT